jgi:phage tail sheath gpL-like
MSISFDLVPSNAVASGVFVEQKYKRSGVPGPIPQRIAVFGQYNTGKTPTVNVAKNVTSADEAASMYGYGSMLHRMIKKLFDAMGAGAVDVDAFPLAAGTGAASGGTITISGTASAAGVISLYIAGDLVQVAVAASDSASTIAAAINAAINAATSLPVTAGVVGAVVTLTPRWVGLSANSITIRQDLGTGQASAEPTGVTVTIVALAGGATDPAIDTALGNFGDTWYTWVVTPYSTDTSLVMLEAAGEIRVGPGVKRPFAGVCGYTDTRANFLTWLNSRNSPWTTAIPVEGSPNLPGEIAASVVGKAAVSAQVNPARPFRTLALVGILPGTAANWTYAQRNAVEAAGGSSTFLAADGLVHIHDMVTTYVTNALGAVDESWRFTVTITNVQAKIYSLDQLFLSAPFDRAIVVDDEAVTGLEYAVSPKRVKAFVIGLIDGQWIPNAWSKNRDDIVAGIVAEIDESNPGRINVLVPDIIAVGLRIMAVKYQWSFAAAA